MNRKKYYNSRNGYNTDLYNGFERFRAVSNNFSLKINYKCIW